jgi:hypothetical protein
MKQASLLITLCALLCLSASAQTTTVEKNDKRITITTTKVDENGKAVTETWIAEGDKPEEILGKMNVSPETLQNIEIKDQSNDGKGERIFFYRKAGDKTAVEGTMNDEPPTTGSGDSGKDNIEKIIIINGKVDGSDNADSKQWHEKICQMHGGPTSASVWVNGKNDNTNCVALGVYVTNYGPGGESKISSLIDKGGAQEAGLLAGDIIKKVDQYDITDFPSLREALSHYQAGDVVTVRYVRGDKNQKARAELKDWAQLPGFEWRARTDCGNKKTQEEDKVLNETPKNTSNVQPLELQDAKIYPNPTDGVFALSFHSEPGPVSIAIADVNGKVVYQENNDNTTGTYNHDIDLKGLPRGNYILSVHQGDKVFTQQISKQ